MVKDAWSLMEPGEVWVELFERSPEVLLLIDPASMKLVGANRRAEECYGFECDAMDGVSVKALVDPGDPGALAKFRVNDVRRSFTNGGTHRRQDGSVFHARVRVVEVAGKEGPLLLVNVLDTSEPDLIDAASGLPDPRLFVDRLEQSIVHAHRQERGLGVCLVLVARLPELLDDLPIDGVRRLLHELGDRLRGNLRESDTVARVGKAEFALIIEGVAERNALIEVLRKVTADFEFEFRVGDEDLVLEPSVGVSVYPNDGHVADMLMENAAIAARHALEGGSGRIRFFTDS